MTENVNEKQLLEVLELDDRKLSSPTLEAQSFAWSGKLESNPLDSIHITGVGEIKVPIISQVIVSQEGCSEVFLYVKFFPTGF